MRIDALPKGLRIYAMHLGSYTYSFAGKAHLDTCKQAQIKPLVINLSLQMKH
jgi:hypothetical protein